MINVDSLQSGAIVPEIVLCIGVSNNNVLRIGTSYNLIPQHHLVDRLQRIDE